MHCLRVLGISGDDCFESKDGGLRHLGRQSRLLQQGICLRTVRFGLKHFLDRIERAERIFFHLTLNSHHGKRGARQTAKNAPFSCRLRHRGLARKLAPEEEIRMSPENSLQELNRVSVISKLHGAHRLQPSRPLAFRQVFFRFHSHSIRCAICGGFNLLSRRASSLTICRRRPSRRPVCRRVRRRRLLSRGTRRDGGRGRSRRWLEQVASQAERSCPGKHRPDEKQECVPLGLCSLGEPRGPMLERAPRNQKSTRRGGST